MSARTNHRNRFASAWVAVLAMLGLLASAVPAAADQPVEIVVVDTWEAFNPCVGGPVTATSHHLLRLHLHRNDVVAIWDGQWEDSAGYTGNSADTAVYPRHQTMFLEHVSWIVSNPETGGKFQVRVRIKVDLATGEVQHEQFTFRCIREPA